MDTHTHSCSQSKKRKKKRRPHDCERQQVGLADASKMTKQNKKYFEAAFHPEMQPNAPPFSSLISGLFFIISCIEVIYLYLV